MTALLTDAQVAEDFGIDVDRLHELRRRNGWPCVRLSRFEVRFTADQVAEIVKRQSEGRDAGPSQSAVDAATAALASVPDLLEGQTPRSAARGQSRRSTGT